MSSALTSDYAAAMTADAMTDLIRDKIRCRGHDKFYNPDVQNSLLEQLKQGYTRAFHYEFVFFDIVDYRKPRPFLLIYTLLEREGDQIKSYTMSMVSCNSVINWYKVNKLSISSTYTRDGYLDPIPGSRSTDPVSEGTVEDISTLELVRATTTHPERKLYSLDNACWGHLRRSE